MAKARALAALATIGVIATPAAAEAANASKRVVTVRVSAPATASTESGFGVALSVEGAGVAGLQAKVLFDGRAVEIGGTAPTSRRARSLGPVAVGGGDLVGYYGGRSTGARPEQVAQVVLFPSRAGRLQIRVGSIEVVDRLGRRLAVRVVGGTSIVQVGKSKTLFRAATPGAARAGGSGRFDADLYKDGQVTKADLDEALYDWGSTAKSGDANGDGVVDVSDVQGVSARRTRHPRLQVSSAPLTFVVNTRADAQDAAPGNGICLTAAGECSLRAAIDEANRHSGPDTITFNIPGGAPQTIQLSLGKLTINQAGLTINGYSEPGAHANTDARLSNALPGIRINGNGANAKESIYVTSTQTTITGLSLTNMYQSVWFSQSASNNTVSGTFIGVTPNGLSLVSGGHAGVMMDSGANHNTVGLATAAGRNVIAGTSEGVDMANTGTDFNVIQNNLIGISPNGQTAWGIGDNGVDHNFGPKNNTTGGLGTLQANVIAGTGNDGVETSHGWNPSQAPRADTSLPYQINDNQILGNIIGFKPDGTVDPSFRVGQCYPACLTNDNGQGVNVIDGSNRTIVEGNWIDGERNGVQINSPVSTGNVIRNNHIGVAPSGQDGFIGNWGVFVHWNPTVVTISGNVIANAALGGVVIDSQASRQVTISRNTMRNVGSPAIDNWPVHVINVNGTQPQAGNGAEMYPVITSASTTTVSGTAPAGATVELYTSHDLPGAYGPGDTFLASTTASGTNGAWSVAVSLSPGQVVTSTATNDGNTGEFGVNVAVPGGNPVVTFANSMIGTFAFRCIDVNGGRQTDGTQLIQYDCAGGVNQRWTMTSSGALTVYGTKCATPLGGVAGVGVAVVIGTCTGGAAQVWRGSAGGQLIDGGLCLEVQGASTANSAALRLNTCNGNPEQRWSY